MYIIYTAKVLLKDTGKNSSSNRELVTECNVSGTQPSPNKDKDIFLSWKLHSFPQLELTLLKNYRNNSLLVLETWSEVVQRKKIGISYYFNLVPSFSVFLLNTCSLQKIM